MKTAEFVIGREWDILSSYGFSRTGNRHIDCPICQSKKKFRISEYKGSPSWICVCGSGDMFSLLIETSGKTFAEVAKEIDQNFGNDSTDVKPVPKPKFKPTLIEPVQDTEVQDYLNGRGINLMPKYGVNFAKNQYHSETQSAYSTMYSIATDYNLDPAMIHRTFLCRGVKISGKSKKMEKVKESQNLAVRMFDADSCLGIGEGIESSLSAAQIFNVPCWATLSTSIMRSFRAPKGVNTLMVFADNDSNGAGLAAAFDCAHRNILSKNDVRHCIVRWTQAGDFNDHLTEPKQLFEWELQR